MTCEREKKSIPYCFREKYVYGCYETKVVTQQVVTALFL